MWCSDGSYIYYTDEQFKNKMTGFTSVSPDKCAEGGSGTKKQLSDVEPGRLTVGGNQTGQQSGNSTAADYARAKYEQAKMEGEQRAAELQKLKDINACHDKVKVDYQRLLEVNGRQNYYSSAEYYEFHAACMRDKGYYY